jgi:hypothetical protein
MEIVAHVPPHREAVGDEAHQFPLATDTLMEHDQLQTEEHFGIDARTARGGIAILYQFSDEGEIELRLKTAVEVVLWHKIFERDVFGEWLEVALLSTHHSGASCRNRPGEQRYRSNGPNIQSLARDGTRISTGCRL